MCVGNRCEGGMSRQETSREMSIMHIFTADDMVAN